MKEETTTGSVVSPRAAIVVGILSLASMPVLATTINFDVDPGGTAVASGTNINTLYQSQGVTFGCFNGTGGPSFNDCSGNTAANNVPGGNAYARSYLFGPAPGVGAHSSPNVFAVDATTLTGEAFNDQAAFGQAVFTTPEQQVSIWANTLVVPEQAVPATDYAYLQAFDSGGHFLGQATFAPTQAQMGFWEQLTFTSGSANIAYVAFSTSSLNLGAVLVSSWDDLCFSTTATGAGSCGAGGGGTTTVPEPATLSLLGLGLVGLGGMRLARRNRKIGRVA